MGHEPGITVGGRGEKTWAPSFGQEDSAQRRKVENGRGGCQGFKGDTVYLLMALQRETNLHFCHQFM